MKLDGMRARARFYFITNGYRMLAWVAKHLPRRLLLDVAAMAGVIGPRILKSKRVLVGGHIQKITGKPATKGQIQKAFASYVRYWFDAFRVAGINTQEVNALVSIDGWDHVVAALKEGRGVILALPHTGNWDVAGVWLVAQGVQLTVVAELLEPPEMFEWFKKFRSSLGMDVVGNGPGIGADLLGALKSNRAVALLCDRDVDGTGGRYEFFGETTRVPKGPATLAIRSGTPLLPVGMQEDGERYKLMVMPAIPTQREGKLSDDVDRVTNDLIHAFEAIIRHAPEEWHVFQPNWPSEMKAKPESTRGTETTGSV